MFILILLLPITMFRKYSMKFHANTKRHFDNIFMTNSSVFHFLRKNCFCNN